MVYNRIMEQRNKKKSFFYCIKPLLLLLLVNYAISFIFVFICRFAVFGASEVADVIALVTVVLEYSLKYATLLNIASSGILLLLGAFIFFKKDYRENDFLYKSSLQPKGFLTAVCGGAGMFMFINVLLIIASSMFDMTALMQQHDLTMQSLSAGVTWLNILCLGLLAPVCEEILVRGLCFNRFRYAIGQKNAIVISALLFGALHYTSVVQMCYTFLLGLLLAYAYAKFENILVPILIHMSFNMMNFLFEIPVVSQSLTGSTLGYMIYYILCVCLCVLSYKLLRKKEKPELKIPVVKSGEN